MSTGFRKSILGFNCDDVIAYIEKTHKEHASQVASLNLKIEEINALLNTSNERIALIEAEKNKLEEEVNSFKKRSEEIDNLSASIGRLYLVSQNSACGIVNNSVESSKIANEEIFKNIDTIDNAQVTVNDVKEKLCQITEEFANKVSELMSSLETAKQDLILRGNDSDKHLAEFNEIFNKVKNTI